MLCGCGDPELVITKMRDLLRHFENNETRERDLEELGKLMELEPGTGYPQTADGWLWLYVLTHMGLIEHGGSVATSWMLGTGSRVLEALEKYGCDPQKWDNALAEPAPKEVSDAK